MYDRSRRNRYANGRFFYFCIVMSQIAVCQADDRSIPPAPLRSWLAEQDWVRDTNGPIISLGQRNRFDDTHIFAPCVAFEKDQYSMWYPGSRGSVGQRVFALGLATSPDGKKFRKHAANPVYAFGDGKHSVLTPTLLRNADGSVLREHGKLRMWFSATHFSGTTGLHTLHETTSSDGIEWSKPSPSQLEHVYAPTILKDGDGYRMWYTDVSKSAWSFRHASSQDGRRWQVTKEPVLSIDQPWERQRLFYPAVVKSGDVYLLWYGSYWAQQSSKTAIGFAASTDGLHWFKNPHNPVLRPDSKRPWESHYTTSQSVMRLADGSWRIWYASRKQPPFVNKYFAINTAHWTGPERVEPRK